MVIALAAGSLTACGVGDGESSRSGSLPDMLAEVPDSAANRALVAWVDIEAARELAGIAAPDPGDDAAGYLKLFSGSGDGPVAVQPPAFMDNRLAEVDDWRTELGFDITDLDQVIEAGQPPEMHAVARGRMRAGTIEKAVRSDPAWKDELETVEYGGDEYWSWLDDGEVNLARRTSTRELGNSLRLWADDGQIRWARTDDVMEAGIDVARDDADSLADLDEFRAIADGLDGKDVYQAYLSTDPEPYASGRAQGTTPEEQEREAGDRLEPWTGFGVGDSVVDDVPVGVLVLAHGDSEAAGENERRLRERLESGRAFDGEPYADAYEIRSLERNGPTLVLTVEQDRPRRLVSEIVMQRGLLVHR